MNFAAEQAEALDDIAAEFGEVMTIRRGANEVSTEEAEAFPGARQIDQFSDDASAVTGRRRDIYIKASAYKPTGTVTTPQTGDEIDRSIGETTRTYRVVTDPLSTVCFYYPDDGETWLHIHTVEKS